MRENGGGRKCENGQKRASGPGKSTFADPVVGTEIQKQNILPLGDNMLLPEIKCLWRSARSEGKYANSCWGFKPLRKIFLFLTGGTKKGGEKAGGS